MSGPFLKQRAAEEVPMLKKIEEGHATRLYSIPWIVEDNILELLTRNAEALHS